MKFILHKVKLTWLWLLLCMALLASCSLPTATSPSKPTSTPSVTPAYKPFQTLLQKVVAIGPVYVTGDSSVPDTALQTAGTTLATMLQHRSDISVALRARGAFTAVSSHTQHICDIPYFTQYNATICKSYGEGGAGGTFSHPVTACDEKNLLAEPDDPYQRYNRSQGSYSQNICVHELAHTVMEVGLSAADRDRIYARFQAAQAEGLWSGDYAMTNYQEFWAVMSQFYFWAGPEKTYEVFNHLANGPDALKAYDPATFALVDSIYKGSANLR